MVHKVALFQQKVTMGFPPPTPVTQPAHQNCITPITGVTYSMVAATIRQRKLPKQIGLNHQMSGHQQGIERKSTASHSAIRRVYLKNSATIALRLSTMVKVEAGTLAVLHLRSTGQK